MLRARDQAIILIEEIFYLNSVWVIELHLDSTTKNRLIVCVSKNDSYDRMLSKNEMANLMNIAAEG